MTKVYLVMEGEYSERQIVAAFSSREKAVKFINGSSEARIDERTLDEETPEQLYREHFTVTLNLESGDLIESRSSTYLGNAAYRGSVDIGFAVNKVTGVSAISINHALKLAAEGRQAWLRLGSPKEIVQKTYSDLRDAQAEVVRSTPE